MHELGYKRFHFLLYDNDWLVRNNPQYLTQLDREYTGLWRRRFLDGEWVQAEGAIYGEWDEGRHIVPADQIPPLDRFLGVALDYGTQHPTRAYAVGIGPDWRLLQPGGDVRRVPRVLYTVAEFAPEVNLSPGKQSTQFRQWLQLVEQKWGTPEWVFVDPAAKHFRSQLHEDGLTTFPAHNARDGGIQTVTSLLSVARVAVSSDCKELIDHIPGYVWDPKAQARGEDKPIEKDDDEVDAWRYAIYSTRRFWRDRIPVSPAMDDNSTTRDIDADYAGAA